MENDDRYLQRNFWFDNIIMKRKSGLFLFLEENQMSFIIHLIDKMTVTLFSASSIK